MLSRVQGFTPRSLLVATIIFSPTLALADPVYSFTEITFPGAISTDAYGINASGEVVGDYRDDSGQHGFTYNAGTFTTFDYAGGGNTGLFRIDNSGLATGTFNDNSGETRFIYNTVGSSTYVPFPDLPAYSTTVASINDSGVIVGSYSGDDHQQHGYIYDGTTLTTLDDPNAVYGTNSFAINDAGQIVGVYYDQNYSQVGFVYSQGVFTTLTDANTNNIFLRGINNVGQIVGSGYDGSFVLNTDGSFTPLVVPGATYYGHDDTSVNDINDEGVVVGTWFDGTTDHSFIGTPGVDVAFSTDVPEPAALALLATGLLGFGLLRQRTL